MLAASRRHQSSSLLRREAEGVRGIHISGLAKYRSMEPRRASSGCRASRPLRVVSRDGDWGVRLTETLGLYMNGRTHIGQAEEQVRNRGHGLGEKED